MSDYNGSTSRGSRGNYQGNNYSDNRSGSHYNDRPGNNNYNDNRMVQYGGNKTRGGFKSRNRVKRNAGSFRPKSDRYYDDEDVNMDRDNGSASTSRPRNTPYEPRGGRGGRSRSSRGYRGSRGGRSASSGAMRMAAMDQRDNSALARMGLPINSATTASGRTGGIPHSKSGWYKALIPYGAEIGKDFIFNKLGEVCTVPFKPMKFTTINKNCHFFVDSQAAAKALKQCSRMIDAPTGRKMLVSVQACDDPGIGITEEKLAKVKVAMSKRWNMETKLLNLKEMYHDEDLRKDGIFLSIGRPDIGSELLRIIEENIPELTSLDLSSNKLYNLNTLGKIEDKVPNLMALNLADNEIKYERDLEKLKGCSKLIELRLAGNPLCDKFDDKTSYIR